MSRVSTSSSSESDRKSSNERKYEARNPAVRWLLDRFLTRVVREVVATSPGRIVDLGCGEGQVAARLYAALGGNCEYLGIDANANAVAAAQARCPELIFELGDVHAPPRAQGWADVALCLEVLEHLPHPELMAARLQEWSSGLVIASVPWEPYFRLGSLLRGKYVSTLGNHPEHCQSFGPQSLRALLAPHFRDVRVSTCFPWLLAVARAGAR